MDAQATDRFAVERHRRVRGRAFQRIKGAGVVLNFDEKGAVLKPEADEDLVRFGVVVTVVDDIGDVLVQGEVHGQEVGPADLVLLGKPGEESRQTSEFGGIVPK